MKNKLSFISIFTLCIALSLTACGGKQSSTTDSKNTQTEAGTEACLLLHISEPTRRTQ